MCSVPLTVLSSGQRMVPSPAFSLPCPPAHQDAACVGTVSADWLTLAIASRSKGLSTEMFRLSLFSLFGYLFSQNLQESPTSKASSPPGQTGQQWANGKHPQETKLKAAIPIFSSLFKFQVATKLLFILFLPFLLPVQTINKKRVYQRKLLLRQCNMEKHNCCYRSQPIPCNCKSSLYHCPAFFLPHFLLILPNAQCCVSHVISLVLHWQKLFPPPQLMTLQKPLHLSQLCDSADKRAAVQLGHSQLTPLSFPRRSLNTKCLG